VTVEAGLYLVNPAHLVNVFFAPRHISSIPTPRDPQELSEAGPLATQAAFRVAWLTRM